MMDAVLLARLQFAVTSALHFIFVPLTLGLSILVAVMETIYILKKDEQYKKMAQFWGKLFVINFVLGVVTGIVQEFHFGMNWSEYSRFVGDIFGAPLAIEALAAFFLESTFLGLWIFGWNKLPPKLHAASIWLVAFGSNLSAFWILVANSFMQNPVGYVLRNGRAEMIDFGALLTNHHVLYQFPHTVLAGFVTAAFFVMGISAHHLLRQQHREFFLRSLRLGLGLGVASILLVTVIGHFQGQYLTETQPMKMAAANALWESSGPAPLNLVALIDEQKQQNTAAIKIPGLESLLAYNNTRARMDGLKDLQTAAEIQYGPGRYIPPVSLCFWSFRLMIFSGFWLLFTVFYSLYLLKRGIIEKKQWFLKTLIWSIPIPYIANISGWIVAEVGRQPWIVFGLQKVEDAVSPTVSAGMVLTSLVVLTLVLGALVALDVYLLTRLAKRGPDYTGDISYTSTSDRGVAQWT